MPIRYMINRAQTFRNKFHHFDKNFSAYHNHVLCESAGCPGGEKEVF